MSDIAIENFGTGVMAKFGLDYEKLRAVKPDLVMMSGTPLGQTGPECGAIGYGPNSLAFSGISHLTGYPGGEPSGIGGTWPDFVVGVVMVIGVLALCTIATAPARASILICRSPRWSPGCCPRR